MRQRLIDRRLALDPPLSREALALKANIHPKSLARIERGESDPRAGTRARLASALEWSMAELALALSENGANVPLSGHHVPATLTMFASLEQAATELRTWQVAIVPGLLQTESYAAVVEAASLDSPAPEVIAERVERRIARQAVLTREPEPLRLFALLAAPVLQHSAGRPGVMATQLEHLRSMAERPNVEIRVVPSDVGRVAAAGWGSFTLLTTDGPGPFMVCLERLGAVEYEEAGTVVAAHDALFAHIWRRADALD